MYGKDQYGTQKYADSHASEAQEEYYTNLFSLVPEFVSEKKEMSALYTTQGYEVGRLRHAIEDTVNQCFISEATWGLNRWEKFFQVDTNMLLTYEQRREILCAKIRGQGTTTMTMLKEAAAAFSGGEVDVIEDPANYRFTVRFIGIKGIPRNMQGFIELLESIKPAHLSYKFEYRYTTWSEAGKYKWVETSNMTWDAFRMLKEDKDYATDK